MRGSDEIGNCACLSKELGRRLAGNDSMQSPQSVRNLWEAGEGPLLLAGVPTDRQDSADKVEVLLMARSTVASERSSNLCAVSLHHEAIPNSGQGQVGGGVAARSCG